MVFERSIRCVIITMFISSQYKAITDAASDDDFALIREAVGRGSNTSAQSEANESGGPAHSVRSGRNYDTCPKTPCSERNNGICKQACIGNEIEEPQSAYECDTRGGGDDGYGDDGYGDDGYGGNGAVDCKCCVPGNTGGCDLNCDHGSCHEESNTCICHRGWGGELCDKKEITKNCNYGYWDPNTNRCSCDEGWKGEYCDQKITKNCNYGYWDPNTNRCSCDEGWRGEYCDQKITKNCNHGNWDPNTNRCSCNEGWRGEYCDQKGVESCIIKTGCLDHEGECTTDRRSCVAAGGTVKPNLCQGRGCVCCIYPRVCNMNCNHGSYHEGTNKCVCNRGWGGECCDKKVCTLNCKHGTCDANTNKCSCDDGWGGALCDQKACTHMNCKHGTCNTNTNKCSCDDGWEGEQCDKKVCTVNCKHGTCDVNTNKCFCDDGWEGKLCDKKACTLNCKHGTCNPYTNKCSCKPGWGGRLCDQRDGSCNIDGKNYRNGQRWSNGCVTYYCQNGDFYTDNKYSGKCGCCSVKNDPHFCTFDGVSFDWHGQSTYIVAQVGTSDCPKIFVNSKFDVCANRMPGATCIGTIHFQPVKNTLITIHYPNKRQRNNNIEDAKIKVDGITQDVNWHKEDGQLQIIKGANNALKPAFMWMFKGCLHIMAFNNDGFMLKLCDWCVKVYAHPVVKGRLHGLCGDWNGNKHGDLKTRNGKTVNPPRGFWFMRNVNREFGDSWEVKGKCPESKDVILPTDPHRNERGCDLTGAEKKDLYGKCKKKITNDNHGLDSKKLNSLIDNCAFDLCIAKETGDAKLVENWMNAIKLNEQQEIDEIEDTSGECTVLCIHGSCNANTNTCSCQHGWGGKYCQQRVCTIHCDHGHCDANSNTCRCNDGWKGNHCNEKNQRMCKVCFLFFCKQKRC